MIKWILMVLVLGVTVDTHAKPNVVFILVDDLGYADIGCYGNTLHETPNVDRLAREGLRFTDAYTACAVCSPTRASIQTGQYPIRFGITDWIPGARKSNTPLLEKPTALRVPLEAVTIAEALKQNGYQTAFVGKWHLNAAGDESFFPNNQGYDVNVGGHHKGSPPGGYFAPFNNPKMENKRSDEYLTDRMGDEAISLIKQYAQDPDQPFFLMLSFYTVHTPIQPKPALKKYYDGKLAAGSSGHWNKSNYAAMVHSMDQNVGRVLHTLDNQGLADDTIVVFFSDNGGLHTQTSCYPLNKGKGFYHEGGIRVPLIIRKPGLIAAETESDVPVVSNDLFPTLLDLAGLPLMPEAHIDGLSLKPVIEGAPLERTALYWHYPHYHGAGETPTSAIRMGDYKLIRHYEDGKLELYNLREDIGESGNLVKIMPEKAEKLEAALDAWLTAQQAYIPVADPDYDPAKKKPVKKRKKKR
jgi:arylsulfatase A-like enzyme